MRKNQKIQLFNSSPNPFSCKEKGKMKSSLFLERGTEGELEIELCRTLLEIWRKGGREFSNYK